MNCRALSIWIPTAVAACIAVATYLPGIFYIANIVFSKDVFYMDSHENTQMFMHFARMCIVAILINLFIKLVVWAGGVPGRIRMAYTPTVLTTSSGVAHTLQIGTQVFLPLFYDGPHPLNLHATATNTDQYRIGNGHTICLMLRGDNPHMVIDGTSVPVRLAKDDARIPNVYTWCSGPYEWHDDVACVVMRCGSTDYTLAVKHGDATLRLYNTTYVCDESSPVLHRFRITWPEGAFGSTTCLHTRVDYGPETGRVMFTTGPTIMGDIEVTRSKKEVCLVHCATKEDSELPCLALFLWSTCGSLFL